MDLEKLIMLFENESKDSPEKGLQKKMKQKLRA